MTSQDGSMDIARGASRLHRTGWINQQRILHPPYMSQLSLALTIAVFSLIALVRVLVGYQPHSGQDNYHGADGAYGGDYEAQRHWMELTRHLSISQWYWYDLEYWGLDYPPLTAYVSWVCGHLSERLIGPESMALETSRGYEDAQHKAFMRATVLVMDMALYSTAVWWILPAQRKNYRFLFAMLQPSVMLVDHGHFQYNTTALGLSLWSIYFISQRSMVSCVMGSILYCCALSFKQMTLYYAPPIFFYLLGWCFADQRWLRRFLVLGVTVISTFAVLWGPVVANGPASTTYLDRLRQVLHRIFPLQRGLFEGKVANIWCVLSLSPIRIRERLPVSLQPLAAALLTLSLASLLCWRLYRLGGQNSESVEQHRTMLLWGTTSSAMAFFLASYQVHEKSLLLALAPASLLVSDDATLAGWFSLVGAWSLWPLLVMDRLQTAYTCLMVGFVSFLGLAHIVGASWRSTDGFSQCRLFRTLSILSYLVMISLHAAELMIPAPPQLPDLFPVLWSVVGCGCCGIMWVATSWHLYRSPKLKVA